MELKVMLLVAATVLALSATAASSASSLAYTNYTVGGNAGWIFDQKANKSKVDYGAWAAKLSFSLGDYLIFNTDGNSTVMQISNVTAYNICDVDADGNVISGEGEGAVESYAVPLTVEGDNYFYSADFDGVPCQKGMRFHIKVLHGSGLPPSLNQPPPPPYLPLAPPQVPSSPSSQQETFYRGNGASSIAGLGGAMGTVLGSVVLSLVAVSMR